jgi:nucleoside-diphosphate-sugar epimerase
MKVLVVGANGQKGQHLINLLKESPEHTPKAIGPEIQGISQDLRLISGPAAPNPFRVAREDFLPNGCLLH